ncbi:MAG TPA: cupredoxin domain-containing protein [Sphingomicrobium sp.]|jgi:plastocyanin|nr:cupredoxin domain-containing protein [Sphingomicrobium sp.]
MIALRVTALAAMTLSALSPAAAQPAAQTIYVWSYDFAPRPIHLRAGQPVTLTFVNRSGSGHDFTAERFFASSQVRAGAAPDGEIELPPGATRSITLVPRRGTYKAHCSHFLHKQLGMSDVIVVD